MAKLNKKQRSTGEAYCPPGMTCSEYISSPQFVKELGEAMDHAAQQAVAAHHSAGRSVWASVNGKWQEIPPVLQSKKNK